jgi:hypothetical protein
MSDRKSSVNCVACFSQEWVCDRALPAAGSRSAGRGGPCRAETLEVVAGLFEAPSKQSSPTVERPMAEVLPDPNNCALDQGDGIQIDDVCQVAVWKLAASGDTAEGLILSVSKGGLRSRPPFPHHVTEPPYPPSHPCGAGSACPGICGTSSGMSWKACLDHGAQSTPSRPRRGRLDQFTQYSPLSGCRGDGRAG